MDCINCQTYCCVLFKEIGEIEEIEAERISNNLKVPISTYFEKDQDEYNFPSTGTISRVS